MADGAAGPDAEARRRPRGSRLRWVGAAAITGTLLALVACEIWVTAVRSWWDTHSFTGDVISSLLVVGATVLIIDEILARRQRKDRAVSVAVQVLIVYGQTLRAYDALTAWPDALSVWHGPDDAQLVGAREEVRTLSSMILAASPSLYDDPEARLFLDEVQRLVGTMYAAPALGFSASAANDGESVVARLGASRTRLDGRVAPLAARLPKQYRAGLDELNSQNIA
jgi:hypothetical protein